MVKTKTIVDDSALTRKAIRRIVGMLDLEVGEICHDD